ncbi:MAG: lasso peptide biosynthesis B2 protein [Clostridium sp.]|uniref:lasso peptide biosynthesis B2 protein n=1 Tax=Clostridium sp. TaxID=1506 RepID=UPI0030646D7C
MLIRKLKTFANISHGRRLRFIEAFIYTGIFRAFILFVPFNKLKKRMGKHNNESQKEVDIKSHKIAREVTWAITQAARHTLWESKCLVQALTAQKMMKHRKISTTIYLGVKKNEKDEMIAHAWVRCGSYYITGGTNKEGYAVVAKFAS